MGIHLGIAIFLSIIVQVFIPGFPKEVLLVQAGASYGIIWGTFINWSGMVIGAQIAYEVVRWSLTLGSRVTDLLDRYQNSKYVVYVREKGNLGLFYARLVPYAPNDVLSLLSGALMLPRLGFFIVSCITALPYALIFAYLGYVGAETYGVEMVFLINLIIAASSLIIVLVRGLYAKYTAPKDDLL